MRGAGEHRAPVDIPTELESLRHRTIALSQTLWAAHPASELVEIVTAIESFTSTLDELELAVVAELEATGGVKRPPSVRRERLTQPRPPPRE